MKRSRPYRLLFGLVALVLLTGAGVLTVPLGGEGHAIQACCRDRAEAMRCPMRSAPPEAPLSGVPVGEASCCSSAPSLPEQALAVVPPVPAADAAVAVLADWLARPANGAEPPLVLDTGPPVSSLRSHLAFSVLLI